MNILGVHDGHNASAVLLVDGHICLVHNNALTASLDRIQKDADIQLVADR